MSEPRQTFTNPRRLPQPDDRPEPVDRGEVTGFEEPYADDVTAERDAAWHRKYDEDL